jgi:lysosomal Pro-X carboxypeptidase
MWENAQHFGALMVFAEHRYYGQSMPWPKDKVRQHMGYLTAEQALAGAAPPACFGTLFILSAC